MSAHPPPYTSAQKEAPHQQGQGDKGHTIKPNRSGSLPQAQGMRDVLRALFMILAPSAVLVLALGLRWMGAI